MHCVSPCFLCVGNSDGGEANSDTKCSEDSEDSEDSSDDTDAESDPDPFKKGDCVRVWWPEFNTWFEGEIEKVTTKTYDVYYGCEDNYATHKKDVWQIERIKNVGEEADSDDDVPLASIQQQRRTENDGD